MKQISLFFVMLGISFALSAQKIDWQHLDLKDDSVFGVSTNKAYSLLKNKKPRKVIVAIIDSGIDTAHVDLKEVLWSDPKTGVHGWNYIGAETGREDITNLVGDQKELYDSLAYTSVPESYRAGYQQYRKLSPALSDKINAMQRLIADLSKFDTKEAKGLIVLAQYHLEHGLNVHNIEADTANGDANVYPDVLDPTDHPNSTPYHGTHVAGIVGAIRNNNTGLKGMADHVELMMLKTNGNIRELRDRSLAKAIIFAVDHGAKVINLSFGKPYTWNKKAVDDAVKYAMKKDVVMVHAAGNNGINIDESSNTIYPNKFYLDNTEAQAWLTVGASGPKDDYSLAANFSNYGVKSVDVFAPGVGIYSTIPGDKYDSYNGTSMATPVVAGLAALIREYYPKLTAVQVTDIIKKTVVKRDILKDKCATGGVVNAYEALKLADKYK